MSLNRFRTVAQAVAPFVNGNTYALLDATDAILAADPYPAPEPLSIPDEVLYRIARSNDDVMQAMRQGKRINAIKALRALFIPNAGQNIVGLRDAKNACEGERWDDVYNSYNKPLDPWDEPPF